jgi:hypothetical protein
MIFIDVPEPLPVILDLNSAFFPNFKQLLLDIGEESLQSTPVSLKIVCDHNDHRLIEFTV